MKKDKDDIIYSLSIEDIQTVALEEIGRELTAKEIEKIKDLIAKNINWYDAILDSINAKIDLRNDK
ncbi:hypothetical protein L0337_18025 [candidate division KSB1 bacterium]|nr:hypothetical protein [candidate division KSB1 bacterium]